MQHRRQWLGFTALALLPALAPSAMATPSAEEHKLIAALIGWVRGMSTMTFMRNGEPHDAAEAAEHMQAKYEHFRKEIVTAEDFIDRCASRSEVTGKPYMVKLADGKLHDANGFLMGELRAMRRRGGQPT
ncbi:DUF5329 family protein [Variovorax paradoxus]|nr:DUF5329 family protein [Variovorax paradoxus]